MEQEETLVHQETSQAQVAQTGCAVSILGGLQDETGQSPEQPGLGAGGRTPNLFGSFPVPR